MIMNKVKLSQCMIVKNEEENIRQALSWAKGIAFEQIVVDTGSTDRTVEIAEEMGAKVYRLKWKDDFSAAKNYAIDQASGSWIAFLDADEYLPEADAEKLMEILDRTERRKEKELPHFIRCSWVQMGDDGKPFSVSVQDRIFRNIPEIRYHGKIHEQIGLCSGEAMVCQDERDELSICHTGYAPSVMKAKEKWKRNIRLLEKELESDPENYNAWSYLGDAFSGLGRNREAKHAYYQALKGEAGVSISRWGYMNAGKNLLKLYMNHPELAESEWEVEKTAGQVGYPDTDNPDVFFFLGLYYLKLQRFQQAYRELKRAFELLESYTGDDVIYLKGNFERALVWMAGICQRLELPEEELYYGILALRVNRRLEGVACEVLRLLKQQEIQERGERNVWELLSGIYDTGDVRDLLFLFKCSKIAGDSGLQQKILKELPDELRQRLGEK